MRIFVHRGLDTIFDATPEQIQKVMNLYNRPGTPGEKAAAEAALRRMGVEPTSSVFKPVASSSAEKKFRVAVEYDLDGRNQGDIFYVIASDEIDAEAKARAMAKRKYPKAKNFTSAQAKRV